MFFLDNLAIQYPHAEVERVSVCMSFSTYLILTVPLFQLALMYTTVWLFVYALFIPIGILLLLTLLIHPSPHKTHVTLLGLAIAFILTSVLTDIIKNAVGRPRPDLLARCKPRKGTPGHELVTFEVCTETNPHVLHDGWRSFPSGHSSTAFSGLGYLSLVLAGQLHVLRPRTDLSKALVAIAPLVGAALIAISRCEDYRHDVWDVTAGSTIGFLVALFSYKRYFPSLRKRNCDVPYPTPGEMLQKSGKGKAKAGDEEMAAINAAGDFDIGGSDSEDEEAKDGERLPLTSTAGRRP
jgi:diacylglycerol diphosphate phosphatase/phosphatidate phosphatase